MGCFCDRYAKENQLNTERNNDLQQQNVNETVPNQVNLMPITEEKVEPVESLIKNQENMGNEVPTSLRAGAPAPADHKEEQQKEEQPKEAEQMGDRFEDENPDNRFANVDVEKPEGEGDNRFADAENEAKKEEEAPKLNSSKLSGKGSKGSKVNYRQEAFDLINKIRQNPKDFISDIEKAKELIQTKDDKLIYGGKVKVALKEGEDAFNEAIDYLGQAKELPPLELDDDITIPVPETEEDIKNSKKLGELVEEKKGNGTQIDSFFKDSVKDFYSSVLLLIVDDAGKGKKKKKRDAIFNKKYKKIGISSRKVGKTFGAYFTFAK